MQTSPKAAESLLACGPRHVMRGDGSDETLSITNSMYQMIYMNAYIEIYAQAVGEGSNTNERRL